MALATPVPAHAANGSAEVMTGDKATTVDVKSGGKVAPKTGIFTRNRANLPYEGNVGAFGLVDLTYGLCEGLNGVFEAQYGPGLGVVPRAGLQVSADFGPKLFVSSTVGKSLDAEVLAKIAYSLGLTDDVSLAAKLETITNWGLNLGAPNHNFTLGRARLGVNLDGLEVGVGADGDLEKNLNVGPYLTASF